MRNVVLVCLDSVRRDYFDEYAPRLRDRADVTVQQCRAASSWSVPSHASMFTGLRPSEHDVHTHEIDFSGLQSSSVTTRLADHRTLCVTSNAFTTQEFNFDCLFDELTFVSSGKRFTQGIDAGGKSGLEIIAESREAAHPLWSLINGGYSKLYWLVDLLPIPSPFDQGAKLVRKHSLQQFKDNDEPILLFTNFMEGHLPHQPRLQMDSELHSVPWSWTSTDLDHFEANREGQEYVQAHSDDVENFRELYGANIEYLDRQVDRFIDEITSQATRETTFVITADHGENLGYEDDGYLLEHKSSLSESLLHVPLLVVNPPQGWTIPEAEERFYSHLQLPRIIESLAYEETYDPVDGVVSAELVGGGAKPIADDAYWDRMIRGAYVDGDKYVWDSLGATSRFELDSSRPCKQTLVERDVEVPEEAQAAFDEEIQAYKSRAKSTSNEALEDDVDTNTQKRLEDLGYL